MRIAMVVALGFVAGCSSTNCKVGTLLLHLALLDQSPLADSITVHGDDPGAAVDAGFPHTPNADAVNVGVERIVETVTWPGGYPASTLVHLHVRALAAGTVVGVDEVDIRLDASCSETYQLVSAPAPPLDGGTGD
jgi:hypothetical protein